jgi:cell division protein FtsZ
LSLGEFSEVGDTIEEFASDDATVVVGTVIDPNMTDELKVTVVATGLGSEVARAAPLQVVGSAPRAPAAAADEEPDYSALERPTKMRRAMSAGGEAAAMASDDYFDIPAFLRRQAD